MSNLQEVVREWQEARKVIDAPTYADDNVEKWAERRKLEWERFHKAEEVLASYPIES